MKKHGRIHNYEKATIPGELILNGPVTDNFKKAHRHVFGKDPPNQEIPYIITVTELKKVFNGLKLRISDFVNSKK